MKKYLVLVLTVIMCVSMCACGREINGIEQPVKTVESIKDLADVSEEVTESTEVVTDAKESVSNTSSKEEISITDEMIDAAFRDALDDLGATDTLDETQGEEAASEEFQDVEVVEERTVTCQDAYALLKDNMEMDYQQIKDSDGYTGRFAYPIIVDHPMLQNGEVKYQSDLKQQNYFTDDAEYMFYLEFYLGHDELHLVESEVDAELAEGLVTTKPFGTYKVASDLVKVYLRDATGDSMPYSVYFTQAGPFTIKIQRIMNDELFTPEELQMLLSCIKLD